MCDLQVAVIGVGNIGSAHAKALAAGKVKGMRLAAVCDADPQKLSWAKQELGCAVFSDSNELINSGLADTVVIATPHYDHAPIAVAAFAHGLNVLTEKPIGVYTNQAKEMLDAAQRSGKSFGIMFNQRTNPLFQKMREIVQSGQLGELKRCVWIITNWYRTQAYYNSGTWRATWAGEGGGVLMNQCPHQLDLWQWIFGMPKRIRGFCRYGQWHDIEVEDDVTAYAEYDNGASAVFITSTGDCPGTNRLEITGDRGKLVWENGELRMWKLKTPERVLCVSAKEGFLHPETELELLPTDEKIPGHIGILQNFADHILKGTPLLAPGAEGIRALEISNAIHLSDWTDEWVELPMDGDRFEAMLNEKRAHSVPKHTMASDENAPKGEYMTRWNVQ